MAVVSVVGGLSTEDPIIVGYVSDIITLRCEHTVAKASLEALAWIKLEEGVQYLPVMAEYDIDDNPPVFFDDSMKGRASIREFPPNLKFHNATLKDAGRYKCQVVPRSGSAISLYYKLNINGTKLLYLDTHPPSDACLTGSYVSYMCVHTETFRE